MTIEDWRFAIDDLRLTIGGNNQQSTINNVFMNSEDLKKRTKQFAHDCVKQAEAHELASIFITTRKTAQKY